MRKLIIPLICIAMLCLCINSGWFIFIGLLLLCAGALIDTYYPKNNIIIKPEDYHEKDINNKVD